MPAGPRGRGLEARGRRASRIAVQPQGASRLVRAAIRGGFGGLEQIPLRSADQESWSRSRSRSLLSPRSRLRAAAMRRTP